MSNRKLTSFSLAAAMSLLLAAALWTTAAEKPADSNIQQKSPSTVVVKQVPLKVTVELEGVVVADAVHEIRIQPKTWSEFTVLEAVPHGASVGRGDVLIRFDSQKLDESIADLETQQKLTELAIAKSARELPQFEESLELSLQAAERSARIAEEDAQRFEDVEREMAEESAEWQLKSAQFSYASQLEELRQLEQMYEADDLTEETEEIILKRQRFNVQRAEFFLENAKLQREETLKLTIPRREESYRHSREAAALALAQAETARGLSQQQKRHELEKLKLDKARSDQKLERLKQDRDWMEVTAPAAGVVYYGRASNGKWNQIADISSKLQAGGRVSPQQVVLTVVEPAAVSVLADVPEMHLPDLKPALEAQVMVSALGAKPLDGRLEALSAVPVSDGKFAAQIALEQTGRNPSPTAGMHCKARLVAYATESALLVPASAVEHDDWSGEDYVLLVGENGESHRQTVQVGRKKDDQVEILDGVSAGDVILQTSEKD